jgi:hypothetical protein
MPKFIAALTLALGKADRCEDEKQRTLETHESGGKSAIRQPGERCFFKVYRILMRYVADDALYTSEVDAIAQQ